MHLVQRRGLVGQYLQSHAIEQRHRNLSTLIGLGVPLLLRSHPRDEWSQGARESFVVMNL